MKIGFTTSFPVEIIFAAGHTPVDINNLFITAKPNLSVREAESYGMPRNICSWIKGIYRTVINHNINTIIGVVQGDCSNTHSLMSLLEDDDIEVISFSFPYDHNREKLKTEINQLKEKFGVTYEQIYEVKKELDDIRRLLVKLDKLTYSDKKVSGKENHYWLVNSSDFFGNPIGFKKDLQEFIYQAEYRKVRQQKIQLGYIGVPPIFSDFYDFFDELDANIIFNEVQRQFSMPHLKNDILDQYLSFTYPYSVFKRIEDISEQISKRNIDGIISYSQAFCHRQIDNILLKKYLPYPYLAIEGDTPDIMDERTKLRLESFLDVIRYTDCF